MLSLAPALGWQGSCLKPLGNDLGFGQPVFQQSGDKRHVLVATGYQLGNREVMDFEAQARALACVLIVQRN